MFLLQFRIRTRTHYLFIWLPQSMYIFNDMCIFHRPSGEREDSLQDGNLFIRLTKFFNIWGNIATFQFLREFRTKNTLFELWCKKLQGIHFHKPLWIWNRYYPLGHFTQLFLFLFLSWLIFVLKGETCIRNEVICMRIFIISWKIIVFNSFSK